MEAITEFLTARLDEDETAEWRRIDAEVANLRSDGLPDTTREDLLTMQDSDHWRRPIADIAAKRAILALHVPVDYTALGMDSPNACEICGADLRMGDWEWVKDSYPCQTVRLLASLYETHKDYDPSWRVG